MRAPALLVNVAVSGVTLIVALAVLEGALALSRPPAVIGLLVLGDSFVEGTGQSDEETTVWLLNEAETERRFQFFNAGISGTNIADYRDTYETVTEVVDVDFESVIVVLFLGNDFLDYERLPSIRGEEGESVTRQPSSRLPVRIAEAIAPNTVAWLRAIRGTESGVVAQQYTARNHIDWFDANRAYFDRGPMTPDEIRVLEERFERIPARNRELIREGRLNMWTYHTYVTEPLNDFVFNMDSEQNQRVFDSTMGQLGRLLDAIEQDDVAVVLVPDKIQVSEDERAIARAIVASDAQEDEFYDVLAVNAQIAAWMKQRYPNVRLHDMAPGLLGRGAKDHYYAIDGHMRPSGAALMAEDIRALFSVTGP
jgi:lysophospholipase L1-like esterase